jgi:lambda family phage portal protein
MKLNFQIGNRNFGFNLGEKQTPTAKRDYAAGLITRLNSDWLMPQTSADTEVASGILTIRGRSRQLERDNPYAQRYLTLIENNVLGADGVGLQMKVLDPNGQLDLVASSAIKKAWQDWNKRANCDVSSQRCLREIAGTSLRRVAADGGVLLRVHKDSQFKYGMALELIEIDQLNLDYNGNLSNGSYIRFGIEFNKYRKAVAYYLLSAHPGDNFSNVNRTVQTRVPAEELLHIYFAERPGQSIGLPWMACAMQSIESIGKMNEAELVASRLNACQGFAIENEKPIGWDGPSDDEGAPIQEMSPGMGINLQPGQKYVGITPNHPNSAFAEFIRSNLRGISAGLEVDYAEFSNDFTGSNFSSMRASRLTAIENYKSIQSWFVENFYERIFEMWLETALVFGAIKTPNGSALPLAKFDKFNTPSWKPRVWTTVNPLEDLQANVLAVEKGFKSRRDIIAEMGGDVEEVFAEQSEDEKLADGYGLEFPIGANPQLPQDTEDATTAQPDNANDKQGLTIPPK